MTSQNNHSPQSGIVGVGDDIYFYRATGEYSFLSNLYRCGVRFEGQVFRSAEDAYQFGKPKDPEVALWLIKAPKPHLCAAAAHALFAFDISPDWQQKKVTRMARVIDAKFTSEDLAEKLIATWPRMLIEKSNTDAFWGIGKKGTGQNMLGILLMATRERLHREKIENQSRVEFIQGVHSP
jgi:hypothetical protein